MSTKTSFLKALKRSNIFVLAAVVAAGLLLAIWSINGLLYLIAGTIIGLPFSGGDIVVTYGFGMILEHYYPLGSIGVEDTTSLTFSPVGIIIGYVILFIISIFISRIIKNKAEWDLIKQEKENK